MSSQAKQQSLEEMARSLIACCAHDIREPFAKDLEAYARTYANQVLREAAASVRTFRKCENSPCYSDACEAIDDAVSAILSMIEGEQ